MNHKYLGDLGACLFIVWHLRPLLTSLVGSYRGAQLIAHAENRDRITTCLTIILRL